MKRIFPSSPEYEEINRLSNQMAQLTNAHLFHDLLEMSDVERFKRLEILEQALQQLLDD